ncbi:hypothetical protein CEXT_503451 [Caerostris extrusa]|uniref:Uncharacterized protein n=1 Tax=Caerostris extrusa TaxID=172846 RepID=A0AAV4V0Y1_CAEEX|nr:hypothetical protein CEXT_503451 [Caerostris extrusa]
MDLRSSLALGFFPERRTNRTTWQTAGRHAKTEFNEIQLEASSFNARLMGQKAVAHLGRVERNWIIRREQHQCSGLDARLV